jgi:hypothetical protein
MAMLTLGSVGDLGATPATAVLGLASVVIYVLPAIVFLLPASLVSAELASGWPGGVYNWVSEGISPQDRTVGRNRGHPWGETVATNGAFRWPPMGSFPSPPSQRER